MDIKNAEYDAVSESVEKVAKNSREKVINGFELSIKLCVLWYPYRIVYNKKCYLKKVRPFAAPFWGPILTILVILGLRGPIFSRILCFSYNIQGSHAQSIIPPFSLNTPSFSPLTPRTYSFSLLLYSALSPYLSPPLSLYLSIQDMI